jgi:hypothetical protein
MNRLSLCFLFVILAESGFAATEEANHDTPHVVTAAVRNQRTGRLVISLHYYRPRSVRYRTVQRKTCIEIDGKEYPIISQDVLQTGSHTGFASVVEEYTIDMNRRSGSGSAHPAIPNIRSVKHVTFILDQTVNGKRIHIRKKLPVIDMDVPRHSIERQSQVACLFKRRRRRPVASLRRLAAKSPNDLGNDFRLPHIDRHFHVVSPSGHAATIEDGHAGGQLAHGFDVSRHLLKREQLGMDGRNQGDRIVNVNPFQAEPLAIGSKGRRQDLVQ